MKEAAAAGSDLAIYRVTSRVIIYDGQNRILVLKRQDGSYELPGGGWEYNETFEQCIDRELREELGVGTAGIGRILHMYRCHSQKWGTWALRVVVAAKAESHDFVLGEEHASYQFVAQPDFMDLNWVEEESALRQPMPALWSQG